MIRLWPSATDAGKDLSIKRSDITANCKNRQKSAHNFVGVTLNLDIID